MENIIYDIEKTKDIFAKLPNPRNLEFRAYKNIFMFLYWMEIVYSNSIEGIRDIHIQKKLTDNILVL